MNINIQFGEIDAELCQKLLNVYRTAKAPDPLQALAAVGGVEPTDLSPKTMRDELAMFSDRHGKDAVKEIFSKLGIHKLGELPIDRYPELRALLDVAEKTK